MVLEPVRWNAKYGWRRMVEQERLAQYFFWRDVGKRMGMKEIPASFDELDAFNREFECKRFAYTPGGTRIAAATREAAVRHLPARSKPRLRSLEKHRSYPGGFQIESLGPPDAAVR
jgi:hypothetical protein